MTFDEWWKDKTAATGELRDFGRKRKAYEVCWLAAQAQCAAGPWQDIKDAPKDGTEVLLGCNYAGGWCETVGGCRDGQWDDDAGSRLPWTHFAPLRDGGA